MKTYQKLAELDKTHIWHPFTQMKDWCRDEITIIEAGEGCFLKDTRGKQYIDGVSSLWCNVHGHRKKEIDHAIEKQLKKIAHSTFLGLSHEPGILLAEKLIGIAPRGLRRVFYSDSGSEAVEIALKMAYQYWVLKGRPERNKFVKLVNAYHGDTLGSVSVGGMDLFHEIYKPLLFDTLEVPCPYEYRWTAEAGVKNAGEASLRALEKILEQNQAQIAAVLIEPLIQGAAGMITQPAGFITAVRALADKYGTLLIFDEVATGFGRTGKMFAAEHENITPDIMTMAKGLTGGYLPLAATLATEEIYSVFLGEYAEFKTFFHGHTYTANPLACAAALANLDLFEKEKTLTRLAGKIELMTGLLREAAALDFVGEVRQAGFMVGIELVEDKKTKAPYPPERIMGQKVCRKAREKGIWLRPLGNVIVLMPPLAIENSLLERLVKGAVWAIKEVTEKEMALR